MNDLFSMTIPPRSPSGTSAKGAQKSELEEIRFSGAATDMRSLASRPVEPDFISILLGSVWAVAYTVKGRLL